MEKIKITRWDLRYFSEFAEKNKLEFKPCVRYVYNESIYFGDTSQTSLCWTEKEKDDVFKVTVMLINALLKNCKLEYVGDKEVK